MNDLGASRGGIAMWGGPEVAEGRRAMASVEDTLVDLSDPIPVDRFEWERIIRRVRMSKGTKYVAVMLATYADRDGTRVRPGVDRMALVMCVSEPTVKRGMSELRAMGLIQRVKQGNRHAKKADEYRLTMPLNLLDLPMLGPDEDGMSGDHT